MQGLAWVSLLRRIPAELHGTLALVLTTGAEVVIQSIIRLERDFIIVRGRMAGSMDAGRVVIVPLDQVNFLTVNKKMTEVEANSFLIKPQSLSGDETAELPPEGAAPADDGDDGNLLPTAPVASVAGKPADAEPDAPAEIEAAPARPGQVSKSILVARLRARLKEAPAKPPGER